MKFIDERIPFICKVSNRDCGSRIGHIFLFVETEGKSEMMSCIPVDEDILEKLNKGFFNKTTSFVVKEIKNIINGKTRI